MSEYSYKNMSVRADRWVAWEFFSRQFPNEQVVLTK
jgi:hypothetical protein